MVLSLSVRQLVALVVAVVVVVALVVLVTMSLTGGPDAPVGDLFAKGTIPWAI